MKIKFNHRRLIRDLGGMGGVLNLVMNSPYRRKDYALPASAEKMWPSIGIPDSHMIMIILAYHARYGHHLDLSQYAHKVGEKKDDRPEPRYEIRDGKRLKRGHLVERMSGVLG